MSCKDFKITFGHSSAVQAELESPNLPQGGDQNMEPENSDIFSEGTTVPMHNLESVVRSIEEAEDRCMYLAPQSGNENIARMPSNIKSGILTFADAAEDYGYDASAPLDETRHLNLPGDDYLGDFFSRPVKIYNAVWGTGLTLADSFNPWELFFEQKRVINRLNNYNLLSSKLHIKFVINGNSFHYGRLLVSYLPLASLDNFTTNSALVPQDAVKESQCPHVFLNPTDSTGGSMVLPFFYHKDMLSVPDGDWRELGEIYIRTLNILKHANDATDQVDIAVFAWAEDIKMAVPTAAPAWDLSPQMGKESEIDEANNKGFISGPATIVSKVAGGLSYIPQIRPFAIATQEVANLTARIAKRFGYCAPPITKAPDPYRPETTSSFALTNVPQVLDKLTVDNKQELTIDPAIAGINSVDPLDIKSIAMRESYLTTFDWTIGAAPNTRLWNSYVDPSLVPTSGGGAATAYHLPACAAAVWPFDYWTGSMKFRFQIVCSNYHKGRLRFIYDPVTDGNTDEDYNIQYSEVVDISDKRDFTMTIGMSQNVPIRRRFDNIVAGSGFGTANLFPISNIQIGNGVLSVYIVNSLTTPNSTANNDIQVNVYISAGEDFEVFAPSNYPAEFVFKPQCGVEREMFPQSGTEEAMAHEGDNKEENAPEQQDVDILNKAPVLRDELFNKVYFGESITTFRSLLKRFQLHTSLYAAANGNRMFAGRFPAFPYWRGNVSDAVDLAAGSAPYNFCNTVMLHYVTNMYSGWRGSIRWKFVQRGPAANGGYQCYVERAPADETSKYSNRNLGMFNSTSVNAMRQFIVNTRSAPDGIDAYAPSIGYRGMTYANSLVNPNVEIEVPYYNTYRFTPGRVESYTGSDIEGTEHWCELVDYRIFSNHVENSSTEVYCAAGEDFTPLFFTGMPRLYLEISPPNPL